MDHPIIKEALAKADCALGLKRRIVGVTFLFTEEEFERAEAKRLKARIPYCVMVKRATRGHTAKATLENFGCRAAARALGLMAPEELFTSGRHYQRLGLYRDLGVAKNIRQNMTLCRHQALGVMIKPLADHREPAHVVLLVGEPYQMMRIVQAYTYHYGYQTRFQTAGNQALCSECTAHVFENNTINHSLLCAGTRFMAGWDDTEMAVGFPFGMLENIVDGLYATLNPTEPDRKKRRIEKRMKEEKREDLEIEYGRNYYTGLYLSP